jgi:hypothetical protein
MGEKIACQDNQVDSDIVVKQSFKTAVITSNKNTSPSESPRSSVCMYTLGVLM